jgi:hypothetical protein
VEAGIRVLGPGPRLGGVGTSLRTRARTAPGLEGVEFGALVGSQDLVEVTLSFGAESNGLAFESGDGGGALVDDRVGGIRFDSGFQGLASRFDLAAGSFAGGVGGSEEGLGLLLLGVGEGEVTGEEFKAHAWGGAIGVGAALGRLSEDWEGEGGGQKQNESGGSGHGIVLDLSLGREKYAALLWGKTRDGRGGLVKKRKTA